jgi:hypothetical protein
MAVKKIGDRVRVPHVFGDEVLDVLWTGRGGRDVLVEIPIEDGRGRVVELVRHWYDIEQVEPA